MYRTLTNPKLLRGLTHSGFMFDDIICNFYCPLLNTFLSALVVSIIIFLKDEHKMTLRDSIIGIGVGIPNQLTTLLILRAAAFLPAYIVYPTYSAGLIIFVNVINYIAFKEMLSKKQYIATAIIGLGLVFINLL